MNRKQAVLVLEQHYRSFALTNNHKGSLANEAESARLKAVKKAWEVLGE